MSYDASLRDPVTGHVLQLAAPHHMRGGTYVYGGTRDCELNVTYNYGTLLREVLGPDGLHTIEGKTGAESIPLLQAAADKLAHETDPDYWQPAPGNVKRALLQLLALAKMRPDGVWSIE